jgi:hypothetical protein
MKRGQGWSTDMLIAGAIFILGIIIFVYVLSGAGQTRNLDSMLKEGNIISDFIISSASDQCSFVDENQLEEAKLKECAQLTYSQLKTRLGANADLCIHFEDEEGRLIDIHDITGRNASTLGIGDERIRYVLYDLNGNPTSTAIC